jgi:hypothetical protein
VGTSSQYSSAKGFKAIRDCRTAALGGHVEYVEECDTCVTFPDFLASTSLMGYNNACREIGGRKPLFPRNRRPSKLQQEQGMATTKAVATKIMVIRHAEKPEGLDAGVAYTGKESGHQLIVRGWQRAGALTVLFGPTYGPLQNPEIETPQFLFASNDTSVRPIDTITPLSMKLGVEIDTTYDKGSEAQLVAAAKQCDGGVLIAWQHGRIPVIAAEILEDPTLIAGVPAKWPGNRFDIVWVFDLDAKTQTYKFSQVPQLILAGDLPSVIAKSASA